MRRLVLPLGLAALFLSPLPSQAQPALSTPSAFGAADAVLTLAHALALAAERSPVLSAARHQVDAAAGGIQQAGLLRNPSFTGLIEDTRRNTRESTATVDIPIELGGKRAARITAAERNQQLAQAELADATAELKAAVTTAFFEVLVAQARVELAGDSATLAARGADVVGRRVAAGKTSPVDETRARVDQVNAALEATEAHSVLTTARQALAATWGDADLACASVEASVDALLDDDRSRDWRSAVDRSPAVFLGQIEVARQRALLEVEKTMRTPDVTVTVGARRLAELGITQAVIGVSVPLPLFDRNQGSIYEAAKRSDKAEDDLQAARIRVINELQRSSNQLSLQRQTAATLKTVVLPAAEDAFRAATRGFEAGKFGFLDVIDAQRTLLLARTRYLTALSSAVQATTRIDRLLGR